MRAIPFHKYHGLGNDFLLLRDEDLAASSEVAKVLCGRHEGVGADGVIFWSRRDFEGKPALKMVIYNRDGSRPHMCGNGVRCVAVMAVEVLGLRGPEVVVLSDAGPRRCAVTAEKGCYTVRVDMGEVVLGDAPVEREVGDEVCELWPADVGNPHAVVRGSAPMGVVDEVGGRLNAGDVDFRGGVNVEFVSVVGPREIEVVVYERGVGRTRACGSGACAAAAVATAQGWIEHDGGTRVRLPGGELLVERSGARLIMSGGAERVYSGEISVAWLERRGLSGRGTLDARREERGGDRDELV